MEKMNKQTDPIFILFQEYFPLEAKIVSGEVDAGWEVTQTIAELKWGSFKLGYKLCDSLHRTKKKEKKEE
jgi:hypothetical protein